MTSTKPTKLLNTTYLYLENKAKFDKTIADFLIHSEIINTQSEKFKQVRDQIKKFQVSRVLISVIDMPQVKLYITDKVVPKMCNVITAKDIKGITGNKHNYITYVNVSDCITEEFNKYTVASKLINVLIARLYNASNSILWYNGAFKGNQTIKQNATIAYSKLFTNVINYLTKIYNVVGKKERCLYASSLFFLSHLFEEQDITKSYDFVKNINDISTREEEFINSFIDTDNLKSIDTFIPCLRDLLGLKVLDVNEVIRVWSKLYTAGTMFGIEFFPDFSAMLTDVYTGSYLNNQSMIEKICGNSLVAYCNETISVGGEYARRNY